MSTDTPPIPVEIEDPQERPMERERCCFCRARTSFWTALPNRKPGAQVACCESCAASHTPKQVPTKKAWWDAETRAMEERR